MALHMDSYIRRSTGVALLIAIIAQHAAGPLIWAHGLGSAVPGIIHVLRMGGMGAAMSALAPLARLPASLLPCVLAMHFTSLIVHMYTIIAVAHSEHYSDDVRVYRTTLAVMTTWVEACTLFFMWWHSGRGFWRQVRGSATGSSCLRLAVAVLLSKSVGSADEVYPPGNLSKQASFASSIGCIVVAGIFSPKRRQVIAVLVRRFTVAVQHLCRSRKARSLEKVHLFDARSSVDTESRRVRSPPNKLAKFLWLARTARVEPCSSESYGGVRGGAIRAVGLGFLGPTCMRGFCTPAETALLGSIPNEGLIEFALSPPSRLRRTSASSAAI